MAEHTRSSTLGGTPGSDYNTNQSTQHSSTGIVDRVKEHATAQLSTQKDKATDGLGTVASAVRQTTQSLRDQHHDTVAGYVEQAADQIERLSQRLKNKDVTELLDDAQQLARRQPALFVGGAFALGLVGARFLKSSSTNRDSEYPRGTYGSYGSTSSASAYGVGRTGTGVSGVQGGVTSNRSTSDLSGTGGGYSSSNYGSSTGNYGSSTGSASTRSTTGSTSSGTTKSGGTSSTAGSTGGRDERERY